jgi:predicted GNAT family acetyltransferase
VTYAPARLTPEACARHLPALEADEVRHNLLVSIVAGARDEPNRVVGYWDLGAPGACAAQVPGRPIVLGDLTRAQCADLAERVAGLAFPAVLGPDDTADWFVARARALGHDFGAPTPQRIHALAAAPIYPGVPGEARPVAAAEVGLAADWLTAFLREALPDEPVPPRPELEKGVGNGRSYLWTVAGRPVSMAAISRRTPHAAAISHVYTPPAERGRGYAGSVTAAVVDVIRAEGRTTACLYTDLRNPASNRCYARIGFRPVCDSHFFARQTNDK